MPDSPLHARLHAGLCARQTAGTLRTLRTREKQPALNFADNDYLALAHDNSLRAQVQKNAAHYPLSASASPLVGGHLPCHAAFETTLANAYNFPAALLWTSGYAANAGTLGCLIGKDDLVFCDRLIHRSMIAGVQNSAARFFRFHHNDCGHLEALFKAHPSAPKQTRWLLTESVYSMDGDSPDLRGIADIRQKHPCVWVLDEAHALGWYGPTGLGLAEELNVLQHVDILVGTLGKALASQGAFTLFRDPLMREWAVNFAPEFIYSTNISPISTLTAHAAWEILRKLAARNKDWRTNSRAFRASLRADGWEVPDGDSPIIPLLIGDEPTLKNLHTFLEADGIAAGAIRPPTVPPNSARLRLSLKRTFDEIQSERLRAALLKWKKSRP